MHSTYTISIFKQIIILVTAFMEFKNQFQMKGTMK